ncbi:MAG TPA: glycerol-3-phosphate acyltransferase, partial [Candidatus Binataceae bacterium]|nr:glycerol-3-phosphate acyltransferase [Candidatus Binataceae bacterium]
GFDPRTVGSGNIGMTNVVRAGGAGAAAATFVGDVLKALIPTGFALWMGYDPTVIALVAFAAFVGSIASVFLRLRGGKGLSAALGLWVVISPVAVGFAAAGFAVIAAVTRMVSAGSLTAAIILPIAVAILRLPGPYLALSIAVSVLVFVRHRENIGRIVRGRESRIGSSAGKKSTPLPSDAA